MRTAWVNTLAVATIIASCCMAIAEERVSFIEVNTSGNEITLYVAGVSRRQALARLCGDAAVEWLDDTFAEEPVKGVYIGSNDKIVIALLDRSNFVITYDRLRISRILVVGPTPTTPITPRATIARKKFAALQSAAKGEQYQNRLRETMLEKIRAAKVSD